MRAFTSLLLISALLVSASVCADSRKTLVDLEKIDKRDFINKVPELGAESFAIFEYRKYLQVSEKGSAVRRQVLIRLAEIELDLAEKLLADEIPESQIKQQQAKGETEQPLDVNQSIVSSISLFETALNEYPQESDNDRVLYQLARAYDVNAMPGKRIDALQRLVKVYPASGYYIESQFRLAEYYFISKDYQQAGIAYSEVLKQPSEFFDNALYKRGWAYFKLANYQQGLGDFVAVLDKYDAASMEQLSRIEKELYQDTLRVISLSFAYLKGVDSLRNYFAKDNKAHYIRDVYFSLGQHYLEKKRYADTTAAYIAFADRYPQSRHAPGMVLKTIEVWQKSQLPVKVLNARETFASRYALSASYWRQHKIEAFPEIKSAVKENVYLLAEYHHSLGQKLKSSTEKKKAVRWYKEYIAAFPGDKRIPGLHFLYAELLSELGQLKLAYSEYDVAAYHYGIQKKSAEAGYAAVVSAISLTRMKLKDAAKNKIFQEKWQQNVVKSTLKFSESFPGDKRVPDALLYVAEVQYKRGHMLESAELAQRVMKRASKDQRMKALLIIGHSQFELELYAEAERSYQALLKLSGKKHKEYKKLRERIAISIYKEAELAQKAGKSELAIAAFLRIRTTIPESPVVIKAEFDAATELMKNREWSRAVPVLKRFRKQWPKHKLNNEVTSKLALAYTENGQFEKAAAEYAVVAVFIKGREQQRVAYYQVAEFYEKASKPEKALKSYLVYLKKYKAPFDIAMEVRNKIINLYGTVKDSKNQKLWRERIILADKKAGKQRTQRSKYLAAMASMALADQAYRRYTWVELKAPFKKNLKKKKARMKTAVNAYAKVLEYKLAASTTEAVYKIGEIYNNFSQSLMKSERPKKLSALEREQYDILLEEQAFPFEEKAIEFHSTNLKRTAESIYDKWIEKSVDKLGELFPGRYLRKEKLEDVIDG